MKWILSIFTALAVSLCLACGFLILIDGVNYQKTQFLKERYLEVDVLVSNVTIERNGEDSWIVLTVQNFQKIGEKLYKVEYLKCPCPSSLPTFQGNVSMFYEYSTQSVILDYPKYELTLYLLLFQILGATPLAIGGVLVWKMVEHLRKPELSPVVTPLKNSPRNSLCSHHSIYDAPLHPVIESNSAPPPLPPLPPLTNVNLSYPPIWRDNVLHEMSKPLPVMDFIVEPESPPELSQILESQHETSSGSIHNLDSNPASNSASNPNTSQDVDSGDMFPPSPPFTHDYTESHTVIPTVVNHSSSSSGGSLHIFHFGQVSGDTSTSTLSGDEELV